MNKTFLLVVIFLITSCNKPVNCRSIDLIDGYSYYQGKPFSGECISYHPTGVLNSIQKYKNGFDHGNWKFYHPNSKLETEAYFEKSKRVGNWRYYFYSGELKQESYYSPLGDKVGTWVIYNKKGDTIKTINHN